MTQRKCSLRPAFNFLSSHIFFLTLNTNKPQWFWISPGRKHQVSRAPPTVSTVTFHPPVARSPTRLCAWQSPSTVHGSSPCSNLTITFGLLTSYPVNKKRRRVGTTGPQKSLRHRRLRHKLHHTRIPRHIFLPIFCVGMQLRGRALA